MNAIDAILADLARLGWRAGRVDWYPSGLTDDGEQEFGFSVEVYRPSYQQNFRSDSLHAALSLALDFARWYERNESARGVVSPATKGE